MCSHWADVWTRGFEHLSANTNVPMHALIQEYYMDLKQSLEELCPIKVILTDVILFLCFAKCLLWLQEPEHISETPPCFHCFWCCRHYNIPAQCWLHSYFYCCYFSWERSSNVEGKDKTGDKRIFLCFHLHRWLILDRFIPCLSQD